MMFLFGLLNTEGKGFSERPGVAFQTSTKHTLTHMDKSMVLLQKKPPKKQKRWSTHQESKSGEMSKMERNGPFYPLFFCFKALIL